MNRHFFTLLAAAIIAAPAVHAQSTEAMHHQRGDSAEHARMMAKLGLTPDQKTRIDAIHEKYAAQMKGAHDSSGMGKMGEKGEMRAEHDSTMKRAMAEVRAVLDPAQQMLFDSMMTEHMKHRETMKHREAHDSSARHGSDHEHMHAPPSSSPR